MFRTDSLEQNTMKDTDWTAKGRCEKGRPRECWMDGVRRSMKRKGLCEEDSMDRNFWRQQIVLGWRRTIVYLVELSSIKKYVWGWRLIGISGSLIWSKTLMELMFNSCGEFRWIPEGPVSQIHSPHLLVGVPGIFSDLLRSVQMLKREWGAESNGKLPHVLNP